MRRRIPIPGGASGLVGESVLELSQLSPADGSAFASRELDGRSPIARVNRPDSTDSNQLGSVNSQEARRFEPFFERVQALVEQELLFALLKRRVPPRRAQAIDFRGIKDAYRVALSHRDAEAGFLVFYTNRTSPKGRDMEAVPYATAIFHWDGLTRQARISGPVLSSPDQESDTYWRTRPRTSQLAAWASDQSMPVDSRDAFLARYAEQEERHGGPEGPEIPRPPHWGGYRLWFDRVELWVAGDGRIHDRGLWTRSLQPLEHTYEGGPWSVARLQP